MARLENPYRYYESPDPGELVDMAAVRRETVPVFSSSGIRKIVEFKKQLIAEEAGKRLSKEVDFDDFLEGSEPFTLDYDYSTLEQFVVFGSDEDKINFVGEAMARGINLAKPGTVTDTLGEECNSTLKFDATFDNDSSGLVKIAMWVVPIDLI